MNRMLSFARLDFITVKPYLTIKNMVFFLLIALIIGFSMGEPFLLVGFIMMYGTIYASYPFAVGDKNGIDTLYSTLAIQKKDIVAGRYIFALCMNILTGIIALIVSAIAMRILNKGFDLKEMLVSILISFAVFSVIAALQLPIYFKLGYAKAKFLVYLPLAAFPAAVMAITTFAGKDSIVPYLHQLFAWFEANTGLTIILIVGIWISILLLSGLLSYRFYKKRDF